MADLWLFIVVAATIAGSTAIVNIAVSVHHASKKIEQFVDKYIESEYCECPCHDEDEWETSDLWE